MAAFRGTHVSPAKHSFGKCDRQTEGWTDRQTDGQSDPYVSLCFAGDTKIRMAFACLMHIDNEWLRNKAKHPTGLKKNLPRA